MTIVSRECRYIATQEDYDFLSLPMGDITYTLTFTSATDPNCDGKCQSTDKSPSIDNSGELPEDSGDIPPDGSGSKDISTRSNPSYTSPDSPTSPTPPTSPASPSPISTSIISPSPLSASMISPSASTSDSGSQGPCTWYIWTTETWRGGENNSWSFDNIVRQQPSNWPGDPPDMTVHTGGGYYPYTYSTFGQYYGPYTQKHAQQIVDANEQTGLHTEAEIKARQQ